jgi:hypothetical protein
MRVTPSGIRPLHLILWVLTLTLGGCMSYGPRSLATDQRDYSTSLGDSWKNQMLANVVKLRFEDMPVFLEVGQIVSGYTLEFGLNGGLSFGLPPGGDSISNLNSAGTFTDRPTITYSPKIGEEYLRSLIEPVSPSSLMSLVKAGYAPELLLTWGVESINGIRNYSTSSTQPEPKVTEGEEFRELVDLLGELQRRGALDFELRYDPDGGRELVMLFTDVNADAELEAKRLRGRALLRLAPDVEELHIRYGTISNAPDVLAIQTRSVLQMLFALSRYVDVPASQMKDANRGSVLQPGVARPFRVYSGDRSPLDAYARVRYRDHWYWIEQGDLASKRSFMLLMFVATLTNRSSADHAPVLTIPTG